MGHHWPVGMLLCGKVLQCRVRSVDHHSHTALLGRKSPNGPEICAELSSNGSREIFLHRLRLQINYISGLDPFYLLPGKGGQNFTIFSIPWLYRLFLRINPDRIAVCVLSHIDIHK